MAGPGGAALLLACVSTATGEDPACTAGRTFQSVALLVAIFQVLSLQIVNLWGETEGCGRWVQRGWTACMHGARCMRIAWRLMCSARWCHPACHAPAAPPHAAGCQHPCAWPQAAAARLPRSAEHPPGRVVRAPPLLAASPWPHPFCSLPFHYLYHLRGLLRTSKRSGCDKSAASVTTCAQHPLVKADAQCKCHAFCLVSHELSFDNFDCTGGSSHFTHIPRLHHRFNSTSACTDRYRAVASQCSQAVELHLCGRNTCP